MGCSFLWEEQPIFQAHLLSLTNVPHVATRVRRDFIFFDRKMDDRVNGLMRRFGWYCFIVRNHVWK